MSRRISDAQTISFRWCPILYATCWAENANEVPDWDASRGCSAWQVRREFKATVKAPNSGYPRLVRKLPLHDSKYAPGDLAHEDVINDIGVLATEEWLSRKQQQRLRNKVHYLSEKYGAPYRHEDNTINAWLSLAVRIRTELAVMQKLKEEGFDAVEYDLYEQASVLTRQVTKEEMTFEYRNLSMFIPSEANDLSIWVVDHDYDPALTELKSTIDLILGIYQVDKSKRFTAATYRKVMADATYERFGHALVSTEDTVMRPHIRLESQGITIECTVGIWVEYKLSQMWRKDTQVLICPSCGTLFIPTRENMRYCRRGTCADKKYRERKLQQRTSLRTGK